MGMKCLICRIPSSVPQGRGDLFDPPPLCPLLGNPGVECHSSQLPLETQSFIMHDSTLWILNAIDDQKICRKTFGVFSDIFFFFCCLWNRLKSGWSSMAALHRRGEKNLGLDLRFASWNSRHHFCIQELSVQGCPTLSLFLIEVGGGGRGLEEQVGKLYFKLKIEC